MVFGIGGGIGAGVFSFFYEAHDFASFYIAGRHLWQDNHTYLDQAAQRFGVTPTFKETGGAKTAVKQLGDALAAGGPVLAWVASAHLPYRGLPDYWSGGDYHVVTVYHLDETGALIGDLLDDPVEITAAELADSRARIKKQKHRIMTVAPTAAARSAGGGGRGDTGLLRGAGAAAHQELYARRLQDVGHEHPRQPEQAELGAALPARPPPLVRAHLGLRLYRAPAHRRRATAAAVCRLLCRSCRCAARRRAAPTRCALRRARAGLERHRERRVAGRRASVPRGQGAHGRKKEALLLTEGAAATDEIKRIWTRLDELQEEARSDFPLTATDCGHLLSDLQQRIRRVYDLECAAHEALGAQYSGAYENSCGILVSEIELSAPDESTYERSAITRIARHNLSADADR